MSHKVYPEKEWFLYQYGRPYILYTKKKTKLVLFPPLPLVPTVKYS